MKGNDSYQTDRALREYLLFHYGSEEEILSLGVGPRDALGFSLRSVELLLNENSIPPDARALDLGCAVGRSSFELAKRCSQVVAIDKSPVFVDACEVLRVSGELVFESVKQGGITQSLVARVDDEVDRGRVRFVLGDACSLPEDLGSFDVVHAANLLCRLPDPRLLVARLPDLVVPGGQLLLATPFTWLEEFTSMGKWIGGVKEDSFHVLNSLLSSSFQLEKKLNLPFLIREHERKFQYGVSLGMLWRRKS
ncbi:MAG: putative 4-mercaptohistidine N1-methyltransferase [Opitutales bacterium]